MSNNTPHRPLHPPLSGPSLSPYPLSLRPSTFRPRTSTPFSRPSPTPAPSTPTLTPRARNPFDALSAPAFDEFVDDITASIRRALKGPERMRRAVEREEGEDVFGHFMVVQEQMHEEDTQEAVEEEVAKEERMQEHDEYQILESIQADRDALASRPAPSHEESSEDDQEQEQEASEEEDYVREEQSYEDRLKAFSKPALDEEEDEYSDEGSYAESVEREQPEEKAVEVIELGSSSEEEEEGDELEEYDSMEDLPTAEELRAQYREEQAERKDLPREEEEGSPGGDDYLVYDEEELPTSAGVASQSREESMKEDRVDYSTYDDYSTYAEELSPRAEASLPVRDQEESQDWQDGDGYSIYEDDSELPTGAQVPPRAQETRNERVEDERPQDVHHADLAVAMQLPPLPSPLRDFEQQHEENLVDPEAVNDVPLDEQDHHSSSPPANLVVDSGATIPLVEYGSGSENGTSERGSGAENVLPASRLEARWGVQATAAEEESDGEEWFGQDASSDIGVEESGSEDVERTRMRERTLSVEKDDDGEPLGTRIPYHLKGKGRALIPSRSPSPALSSVASSFDDEDDDDSDVSLEPEILALYDLKTLRGILERIAGSLELAAENGEQERVEHLERQMDKVAEMHNVKIEARTAAGESSSEEETDDATGGDEGEEAEGEAEEGQWEDVVALALRGSSEDERPATKEEAFDVDQIQRLAAQLVAMEDEGRRAPLEVGAIDAAKEDDNQKRRKLVPFKLRGERRPFLGDGGIPYPVLEEEEVEMGEDEFDEDLGDDEAVEDVDEADEKEEVEDANAQKRRRLLPFKLPGERRPLLGDGGIPYPVLEEEEEVEMGEDELDEDAVDDKDAMDDRDDDATTSKYFGKDRSSTSPRKQPRDFDSPASPRQIGSPPADDESPTVNPDNTPAPDVVSPPPVADRSSSPLEVASPPPAADASSPLRPYSPPAAADHIAFDNDGYEEGSGDELGGAEAEEQETRVRRTGDVPEEETMVVSEDIVLGSSDVEGEREGEAFQDGRRRDSSEPLAYESTEDGEVEAVVEEQESSPPRVKNVISAGAWDPTTPILFGDALARDSSPPPAEDFTLGDSVSTRATPEDDQLATDESELILEPFAVEEGIPTFADDIRRLADFLADHHQGEFDASTTTVESLSTFASPTFNLPADASLAPEPTRDEPYSQAEIDALLGAYSGSYAAPPTTTQEYWNGAPEATFDPPQASSPAAGLPLFDPPADDPLDLASIFSLPPYEPELSPVPGIAMDLSVDTAVPETQEVQAEDDEMLIDEGSTGAPQEDADRPVEPPPLQDIVLGQDTLAAPIVERVAERSESFAPAVAEDGAQDSPSPLSIPTAEDEQAAAYAPISQETLNEPTAEPLDGAASVGGVPAAAVEEPIIVEVEQDDQAPSDDYLPPDHAFLVPTPLVEPISAKDDQPTSGSPPATIVEEPEESAFDARESHDAFVESRSEGTRLELGLELNGGEAADGADLISSVADTAPKAATTPSDVPAVLFGQAARSPSPIAVAEPEQVEVRVEEQDGDEDDLPASAAVCSEVVLPEATSELKMDPLPSPIAADDSESDDELMLAPSQRAAKVASPSKRANSSFDARAPPRRQSSRLGGTLTQAAPSPSPEPSGVAPPTPQGEDDTSETFTAAEDHSVAESHVSERSAISSTAPTRRRSARNSGGAAVSETIAPTTTASPSRSKRPRASDSAASGASLAPPSSASPSATKRRRGTREGSRLRDVVSGDEEAVARSPPPARDTSECPPASLPPHRLHHHVHSTSIPILGAGLPHEAAPSTPASSHSRTRSIGGTITHLPITRSNCEFTRLELYSKDLPSSPAYVFLVPSCALASQAAQETIADYNARDLGPAGVIEEAEAIRLGGGGLETDRGAAAEDLIEAEDVRSALRRIIGVELWHEGTCELLPRVSGAKEEEPATTRRGTRASTSTPAKRKREDGGEGEEKVESRAKGAKRG